MLLFGSSHTDQDITMTDWIWQHPNWTQFTWDAHRIQPLLIRAYHVQGTLLGASHSLSHEDRELTLDTLLQNIITSSAIENEQLNASSVRSSLARRLNLVATGKVTQVTEGLAEVMLDAVNNINTPLTLERLFQWHTWLFPLSEQGFKPVLVGTLRGEEPMQVVSGRIDRPKVHFEAPPRERLNTEMNQFLAWFSQSQNDSQLDKLIRAGITHLWFVTIHPFDDGNGRITRTITDLALAQADQHSIRLYAMSSIILQKRSQYYTLLESTQRGTPDITHWLEWFLQTLIESCESALNGIQRVVNKTRFWQKFRDTGLLAEQAKVLNRLLDGGKKGFEHGISAAQYQTVAKVSKATATRHLTDLLAKGYLQKMAGGGRNTRYQVKIDVANHPLTTSSHS
jgi:Fic family protein